MTFLLDAATGLSVVGALLGAMAVVSCRRTATGIIGFSAIGGFVSLALLLQGAILLAIGQLVVTIAILAVVVTVAWVAVPRGRTEDREGQWEIPPARAALFGVAWVAVAAAIVILGVPPQAPATSIAIAAPWPVTLGFGLALLLTAGLAFVHFAAEPLDEQPEAKR